MKKTININLGSVPFIIDEDAYDELRRYLGEIDIRLDRADDKEVLEDIESRIADIFKESITEPASQVVNYTLIRRAIAIIGPASEFGEPKRTMSSENAGEYNSKPRKLYRSRSEKVLSGVCGGIAKYLDMDVTLVRIITFLLVFLGGLSFWIYIILWIALPLEPRRPFNINSKYTL